MKILNKRRITKRHIGYVFAVIIVVVHFWSIINLLRMVPAWILRLSIWELIGCIAYTQAYAFFESLTVLLIFLLLGVVIPGGLFAYQFVAQSTVTLLAGSIWAILIQYNYETIREFGGKELILWLFIIVLTILAMNALILRYEKIERIVQIIAEKVAVLAALYAFIGLLSWIIVIFRNISQL